MDFEERQAERHVWAACAWQPLSCSHRSCQAIGPRSVSPAEHFPWCVGLRDSAIGRDQHRFGMGAPGIHRSHELSSKHLTLNLNFDLEAGYHGPLGRRALFNSHLKPPGNPPQALVEGPTCMELSGSTLPQGLGTV